MSRCRFELRDALALLKPPWSVKSIPPKTPQKPISVPTITKFEGSARSSSHFGTRRPRPGSFLEGSGGSCDPRPTTPPVAKPPKPPKEKYFQIKRKRLSSKHRPKDARNQNSRRTQGSRKCRLALDSSSAEFIVRFGCLNSGWDGIGIWKYGRFRSRQSLQKARTSR
jgi:hypothetical protein